MTPALLLIEAVVAAQMSPVERLNADLLAARTATSVLEARCAALGLADPPRVRAEVERGRAPASASPARTRLKVGKDEVLGYRRVRLMCGDHLLSEATNWYVASRLTPEMNAALANTNTPFGKVAAPLKFRREAIETVAGPADNCPANTVSTHLARLILPSGKPLAYLVECYTAANLAP